MFGTWWEKRNRAEKRVKKLQIDREKLISKLQRKRYRLHYKNFVNYLIIMLWVSLVKE
jgi:hypothetical protein